MHTFDLTSNALNNGWFEAAPAPNYRREWRIYSSDFSSRLVQLPGPAIVEQGGLMTFNQVSAISHSSASEFIVGLTALTERLSQGLSPVSNHELRVAADKAVESSKSTDIDVETWAKRLAASVLKH
jgi:hypothetical protein